MIYVLYGEHSPEICPTSNAKTRELMFQVGPEIPTIAEKNRVKLVAGPYVSREHVTVLVAETDSATDLDNFLMESRLPQWNSIRIIPSLPVEEGMKEIATLPAIY